MSKDEIDTLEASVPSYISELYVTASASKRLHTLDISGQGHNGTVLAAFNPFGKTGQVYL